MTNKRVARRVAVLVIVSLLLTPMMSSAYDWPQFNGDPSHSGNNVSETLITRDNLSSLQLRFHVTLPEATDSAPAYLSAVSTLSGTRSLLFLTTKAGRIIALDASSGMQIWAQQPADKPQFTTSSPAIDPNRQFVYSYGLDGYVHKYQVGDGTEIKDAHWPELVSAKPFWDKQSSALAIATARNGTSYLYATSAGFAEDVGDYQGHITAINLADGSQRVFNAACSDQNAHFVENGTPDCAQQKTGIWARPGVVYDTDLDRIYAVTGNGDFNSSTDWGDSVLALNPDGSGVDNKPLDSYTPPNYQELQDDDNDLGSSSVVILPAIAGSKYPHLAAFGAKDANLRLINLDNMSGQGGPGHTGGELQTVHLDIGGAILPTPAVWRSPDDGSVWLFVTNYGSISGWQVVVQDGQPQLVQRWTHGPNGSSPIVANGILYCASSNRVYALDPTTGNSLWQATDVGAIHWQSVVVANGALYVGDDEGHLFAYTPGGVDPAILTMPTPTPPPGDAEQHTFTETGHTVSGRFLHYWQDNGGLDRFGYPISDPLTEVSDLDGKRYQVQYFERAEFEWHPENQPPYDVLLTQLGALSYKEKYPTGAAAQQPSTDSPYQFAETGKTIGGSFRTYWEQNGGLVSFGYPITDQFQEQSALDGKTYTVQYFERAVFEYHPENASTPYTVELSQLGKSRWQEKHAGG